MVNFNKRKLIISVIVVGIIGSLGFYGITKEKNETLKSSSSSSETIAMYVQDDLGEYIPSSSKEFPREGYFLNTEKSYCKNGGTLTQDPETLTLSLSTSKAEKCMAYFVKDPIDIDFEFGPNEDSIEFTARNTSNESIEAYNEIITNLNPVDPNTMTPFFYDSGSRYSIEKNSVLKSSFADMYHVNMQFHPEYTGTLTVTLTVYYTYMGQERHKSVNKSISIHWEDTTPAVIDPEKPPLG